jgi:hypothetical protein
MVEELLGDVEETKHEHKYFVLSEERKTTLKVLPIAVSWSPVAAEYVLDQKQYQKDLNGVKEWRGFDASHTHASEDAFHKDTNDDPSGDSSESEE